MPASLTALPATDALTLRDATIGEGLILNRPAGGSLELLEVRDGSARLLGAYTDVLDAWAAVDVLDLAALEAGVPARFAA
jgi:hypothetical protein